MALNAVMLRLLEGKAIDEALAPIRISATSPTALPLSAGTDVRAQVLGQLDNGQAIVRIAGELLAMELPTAYHTGDTLPLTYVGSEPRPTFLLSRQTVSGMPVNVSELGRLLGQLAQEQPAAAPPLPEPLPSINRLTTSPPLDAAGLADRLREALTKSGVFYESHLAQWAEGKRQLAELLQEPQAALSRPELLNRLTPTPGEQPLAPPTEAQLDAKGRAAKASPPSVPPPAADRAREPLPPTAIKPAQPSVIAAEDSASRATSRPENGLADPQTFPLIRQQLAQLNSGQFVWQGEAWPGQQLQWEVAERDARDNQEEADGAWQTSLRLDLPNLGEVRAALRISGARMQLHLQAAAPTALLMQQQAPRLHEALGKGGVNLANLVINHGETDPA
jgi:flagellar hook-length control protein FliK